jgi:16S rRNA U516 pseudouridylate synthase RsuA-like enzyme
MPVIAKEVYSYENRCIEQTFDVLSQFREDEAHITTVSLFIHDPDLRLAGRLDMDSEGYVP